MSYTKKIGRHYGNLMQNLNAQRTKREFCDLTIVVCKEKFTAHKCVLAAASKKLHKQLTDNMLSAEPYTLYIDSITPHSFKIVLEYIYTSSLWIPNECLSDVSSAAKLLEMDDLVQSCLDFSRQQRSSQQQSALPPNCADFSNADDGTAEDDEQLGMQVRGDYTQSSAELLNGKLPELDSSLSGLLDSDQHHGLASYGNDNSGSRTPIAANHRAATADCKPYPDQDALSEISIQNDVPDTDVDERLYSYAHDAATQNGVFAYNQYIPGAAAVDANMSNRLVPRVPPNNIAMMTNGMHSHSLLHDNAAQYPIDAF